MLNHIKVIELASVLAGPSAGQFFAELGAEVIKVENVRTKGDVTRTWKTPGETADDRSAYFCSVNWGKKSVAVDLTTPEGREIVYGLIKTADVLITSFKPGDAQKLKVDYDTIRRLNQRLIYGQVTGYGSDSSRVGYDALIQAEAGFMFMNGTPGGPSLKMPVALMDIMAAHHLKEGILLALLQRERTGKGGFVEVSLIQAAISSLANQATNWLMAGMLPQKQGSSHPNIAPYGDVFKTVDNQELLLAVGNDRQFFDLCHVLELNDLPVDPRFAFNQGRVTHRDTLTERLANTILKRQASELLMALHSANVPAGIIQDLQQVFDMPVARQLVLAHNDASGLRNFVARSSMQGSDTSLSSLLPGLPTHFLPPPGYGEHTTEVLRKTLELSSERVQFLFQKGIIA